MSSANELRKWLNREDHSFSANLQFGINVWRSMEFVLITKHEIITEEFCRNLPNLRKELKRTGEPAEVAWSTISEFLSLKYSAGAISSTVKEQLVNVLRAEAKRTLKNPHPKVLNCLLSLFHSQPLQNYYKSAPDALARLIGTCFAYLNALVENCPKDWSAGHQSEDVVVKYLNGIHTFVKQTPQLEVFRKAFTTEAFVTFTETVILLKHVAGKDVSEEFFAIIQDLYFPVTSTTTSSTNITLKQYLVSGNGDEDGSEFSALFGGPMHALMMWLEAILIAFKPDTETQAFLHSFLFKGMFGVAQTRFESSSDLLQCITYYLCILKRHNALLSTKIGDVKVESFIGKHVEQLFNLHCESVPADVLDLLCAALRLEPMMLEQHLVAISVRCMVLKKDEESSVKFTEFMCLIIDVFRRLRRAEKFMSQILVRLVAQLAQTKLSSKMKRKSLTSTKPTTTPKFFSKLNSDAVKSMENINGVGSQNDFFDFLRSEFVTKVPVANESSLNASVSTASNEWSDISFAWPLAVGQSFSRFISGLVTRPAITVWKTLIFSMLDCITLLKEGHSDNNTLFLVDITAAMLCQYFNGCRLAEHVHSTWDLINSNRELTHSLLQEFGTAVLSQEHNVRTMNSFLKCCSHLANFELLCFYYWPDTSNATDWGRNIHPYLATQQWTLIEQRITNFGRNECRANMNRLYLQRIRATLLFNNSDRPNHNSAEILSGTPVIATTLADHWQIESILNSESSKVFLNQLTFTEVAQLCELVLASGSTSALASASNMFSGAVKNKRFVTILYVTLFKQLADRFNSKKSILNALNFESLLSANVDYETSANDLVKIVRQFVADVISVKKFNAEKILEDVAVLRSLPVEFVGPARRNFLFMLNVVLYVNVKATGQETLVTEVLSLLKAFLHFGETPALFRLLSIDDWIDIFGGSEAVLPLYRNVFDSTVKQLNTENLLMFDCLRGLLMMSEPQQEKEEKRQEHALDVAIVLLDFLSKEKKCKEYAALFRKSILTRIRRDFPSSERQDEHVSLVNRTISGFNIIVASILSNVELAASSEVDDVFLTIFKQYVQLATPERHFGACVKLLGLTLAHQKVLQLTDEYVREKINQLWSVFMMALKSPEPNDEINRNTELFLKTILNNKTQEEFVDLLEAADEADVDVVDSFTSYKHKLFASIAKCQLNKTKGILFNEIFKQVSLRILMSIRRRGDPLDHLDAVQKLLDCQKLVCANIQIPVSVELIDDIIAFLSEINVKRVSADPDTANHNNNQSTLNHPNNPFSNPNQMGSKPARPSSVDRSGEFEALHSRMSDVCFALIQHRHFFIVDRVAQFVTVLRDMLQSVAWYKSGRKKEAAALDNGEITMLAELSHRLENIIKSLVKHAKDVKRVAPYLLIFTINLMISNEQPTTVFSKIKTHFESICFDLISVCDHRVEGFIMRNCNEASKQLYEQLIKEYNKYHKFKGKV